MPRSLFAPTVCLLLLSAARGATGDAPPVDRTTPPPAELAEILNAPISVASARPRTLADSPGVVTCITREEILASGARDLMDVLRLVPGFGLAYDNQGATGLSVRGLWAFEGKALVLWDGLDLSELLTGTLQLGHRFPADQIKRIEIIRGPGSARYGGGAELAVINIISLGAEHLDGVAGGATWGQGGRRALRQGLHALYAHGFASGVQLSLNAYGDRGLRSARPWTDNSGHGRDAGENSEMKSALFTFGLRWKGLRVNGLLDDYTVQDPIYRSTQPQQWFKSYSQNLAASWTTALRRDLKLIASASYRRDSPNHRIVEPRPNPLDRTVLRLRGGLRFEWDIGPDAYLGLGSEHTRDEASTSADTSPTQYLAPGQARSATYRDTSSHMEFGYHGLVDVLVGGRYEQHSAAGSAFVPRFALTKAWRTWHVKLLHAGAFRTPGVLHYKTSSAFPLGLEPERTRTTEAEVGLQRGAWAATLNLFRIRLEKPILDFGTTAANGPDTGSRGAEVEFRLRRPWGLLNAAYAYHEAFDIQALRTGGIAQARTTVPGQDRRFLAAPQHSLTGLASIWLGRSVSLDPSCAWLGARYGGTWDPERRRMVVGRFAPSLLLNLQAVWRCQDLSIALGAFDLLDARPGYLQAYFNSQAPLPDGGRELVLKVRWGF